MPLARCTWLMAALAIGIAACSDPRALPQDSGCPTWKDDIAPALDAASCTSCHAGAAPAAHYALDTYLGALGKGSDDTANAIAGDPSSLLVTELAGAATGPHAGQAALHAQLTRWVGSCKLAYFDSPLHPGGILDPSSSDFHGQEVERRGWDLPLCATCHGADYGGTTKAPSCRTCHTQGPTACDTCHPANPTTGAHTSHLDRGVACSTCHEVPAKWDDDGHIFRNGAVDPAPAEVTLSGFAATTLDPADRTGPPTYDPATGTCSQVYCHGAVLHAGGGTNSQPSWRDDPPGPPACSSCHGAPPPSHARSECGQCHPSGDRHLDGAIEIGDGGPTTVTCSGCHGSATSPAPPRDLSGNTLTSAIGVGAHQAHLVGPHRLAAPVPCATCHVVPATLLAAGHLDSAAPAEVTPALGWNRDSQTCASAWCHGPARPVWTTTGGAFCGSCHDVPPATPAHQSGGPLPLPLSSCVNCHPSTVDAFGNIKVTDGPNGPTSTHMNGVVDAP
ncbi:MAG TPA: CxxxxCH/CxxCH domain-containing protein [Kofleriaceae bacterium]|nr:CxxxxCH/CxxCH domain-containing protein [Kofleriaceae bacterium]